MYTTQAQIESRLGSALTSEQLSYYNDTLDAAIDRYIRMQTGTSFGETEPVSLYVDGECTRNLIIPTMHDVTAVYSVNDDLTEVALVEGTDYVLFPRTGDVQAIRRLNGVWEEGWENYKVVGVLGWKDMPADIAAIATELAVNDLNANLNNYQSEKVGDWAVTYKQGAAPLSDRSTEILCGYKRLSRSI